MSKRQRFFVELVQDQVTMVSWKQLVAEGERISTSEGTAPSTAFPAKTLVPGLSRATIPHNSNTNSNTTESNPLKSRGKLRLSLSKSAKTTTTKLAAEPKASLDERTLIKYTSRAEPKASLDERTLIKYTSRVSKLATQIPSQPHLKRIAEAKLEFGPEPDPVAMKLAGPKGKVHRSMPGKTSCRTKKKTRACFCCSKQEPGTQT